MNELSILSGIGLPGWFIIAAATVFILERIGLFKLLWRNYIDRREFEQSQEEAALAAKQSEQVVLWQQMINLQSKTFAQYERLLDFVISTSDDWHRKHHSQLEKVMYELRQTSTKLSIMVGIMEKDYDTKRESDGSGG